MPFNVVRFRDPDGELWTVLEIEAAAVARPDATRCLVFVSATKFRRVWDYPADWSTLSPAELHDLSWRT